MRKKKKEKKNLEKCLERVSETDWYLSLLTEGLKVSRKACLQWTAAIKLRQ